VLQHLCFAPVDEHDRPSSVADIQGLVVLIEHQDCTLDHPFNPKVVGIIPNRRFAQQCSAWGGAIIGRVAMLLHSEAEMPPGAFDAVVVGPAASVNISARFTKPKVPP
jgi:hypothetical protein